MDLNKFAQVDKRMNSGCVFDFINYEKRDRNSDLLNIRVLTLGERLKHKEIRAQGHLENMRPKSSVGKSDFQRRLQMSTR